MGERAAEVINWLQVAAKFSASGAAKKAYDFSALAELIRSRRDRWGTARTP
jgi:hypothetical protein